jgi:glutamate synthase domain-containing protein 2
VTISLTLLLVLVLGMIVYDLSQKNHAILRNFPIIGHFRYWLEQIGPEVRQYLVTSNDEERPFSRDQRRWMYASSKKENRYFGFGTDNDLERTSGYLIIKHATLGYQGPIVDAHADPPPALPCAKVLGGFSQRRHAFRPASLVNVSGMSFGALSANAVQALNRGAQLADCLHSTGEGGLSVHHQHGGELIFQIGTAYFGCRDDKGDFDLERLAAVCAENPVRAIEIKLSQGAKPGIGGFLPGRKVTREIAQARGIPLGEDCASPPRHTAFSDPDGLLDFVERLAERTGLPVGIKSAVGEAGFWQRLAHLMCTTDRAVDFIVIDGGEGGTGASPLVVADHVALPFKLAMSRVYSIFAERDLHERIVFVGSGKLGLPEAALLGMGLGCDMIHVGREAMLAIGCIQAQRCHTDHCPAGVATQNRWLQHGLDPGQKSVRLANYVATLRLELLQLAQSCGVAHPALVPLEQLEILDDRLGSRTAREIFGYREDWGLPAPEDRARIEEHMIEAVSATGKSPG